MPLKTIPITTRFFTLAEIATITDVDAVKLRTWITRGIVTGESDGERGSHRRFSFFTAMEIAIAGSAFKLSAPLPLCFAAGRVFSHIGSFAVPSDGLHRHPPLPFSVGETYVSLSATSSIHPHVFCLQRKDDLIEKAFYSSQQAPESFVLVNASKVFERVCSAAGHDAQIEIDKEYSKTERR